MGAIADRLNTEQVKCVSERQWSVSSISYIHTNERYIGDSLWQKTYMTDEVPYKHRRNNGELTKYCTEETHPPIIERDTFTLVQELIQKRQTQFSKGQPKHPYPLRKKVACGHCGATYRWKVVRKITCWCCPAHDRDMAECPITQIVKGKIFIAFLRLYYKLLHQDRSVLVQLLADLQTVRSRRLLWSLDIMELNNQIADLTRQERLLTVLKKRGAVDPDIFISQTDQLAERLRFRLINGLELTENIERTVR